MDAGTGSGRTLPHALIAGGGVAALEACLFLRAHVTATDLAIDLLTPSRELSSRPLAVVTSFGGARRWSTSLETFAADHDVTLVHDGLARVMPAERTVETTSGVRAHYDALLVAVGAGAVPHLPGAVTLRGADDAPSVRRIIDEAATRLHPRLTFVVGSRLSWAVPLYELALLAAVELGDRGRRSELSVVTPEAAPLELLGASAGVALSRLLAARGVNVIPRASAIEAGDGELRLADGRTVRADRAAALPRAVGRFVDGLPHDDEGFIPVDGYGRVDGVPGVFAAGDATAFPLKQGAIAAQQADAAASAMLAELGFPVQPSAASTVLTGLLQTDGEPEPPHGRNGEGPASNDAPRGHTLWWPPSRLAGSLLGPYLARRGAVPGTPAAGTPTAIPIRVDVARVAAASGDPQTHDVRRGCEAETIGFDTTRA
jgi:sulfide:quinone oxidoreductase